MSVGKDYARELAARLAGAAHSRRIYSAGSPVLQTTLESLHKEFVKCFEQLPEGTAVTVALLGDGLAISGQPILEPSNALIRLIEQMKARDVEIISFQRGATIAELDAFLTFLNADPTEVGSGGSWLREHGVQTIEVRHLNLGGGSVSSPGLSSYRDVFRGGAATLQREFKRAAAQGDVEVRPLVELSKTLVGLITPEQAVPLLLPLRDREDFLALHSMNVAVLTAMQAMALDLSPQMVAEACLAGLLHDVGKTRLPPGLLEKTSGLSEKEQLLLDNHGFEGARIITNSPGAPALAAIVAMEHHMPSKGTPTPLIESQLIDIADAFDTLRSLRPFQDRERLRVALELLNSNLFDNLSPYLVSRFATLCNYFREGDSVVLTSGDTGRVVDTHPESAWHPMVEILESRGGKNPPGTVVDLALRQPEGVRYMPSSHFQGLTAEQLKLLG
ncbi:MAG: HD-GYP domain-containing protein [Myxococcaceae bacterium]